jgi:hypothetical protein
MENYSLNYANLTDTKAAFLYHIPKGFAYVSRLFFSEKCHV